MRHLTLFCAIWLAATPAAAKTLATTYVRSPAGASIICAAVNAGKKTVEVVFRVRGLDGAILNESGAISIPPKTANGVGDGSNDDFIGWCEFDVKGKSKGVRASLQLHLTGSSSDAPDLVVPAH